MIHRTSIKMLSLGILLSGVSFQIVANTNDISLATSTKTNECTQDDAVENLDNKERTVQDAASSLTKAVALYAAWCYFVIPRIENNVSEKWQQTVLSDVGKALFGSRILKQLGQDADLLYDSAVEFIKNAWSIITDKVNKKKRHCNPN